MKNITTLLLEAWYRDDKHNSGSDWEGINIGHLAYKERDGNVSLKTENLDHPFNHISIDINPIHNLIFHNYHHIKPEHIDKVVQHIDKVSKLNINDTDIIVQHSDLMNTLASHPSLSGKHANDLYKKATTDEFKPEDQFYKYMIDDSSVLKKLASHPDFDSRNIHHADGLYEYRELMTDNYQKPSKEKVSNYIESLHNNFKAHPELHGNEDNFVANELLRHPATPKHIVDDVYDKHLKGKSRNAYYLTKNYDSYDFRNHDKTGFYGTPMNEHTVNKILDEYKDSYNSHAIFENSYNVLSPERTKALLDAPMTHDEFYKNPHFSLSHYGNLTPQHIDRILDKTRGSPYEMEHIFKRGEFFSKENIDKSLELYDTTVKHPSDREMRLLNKSNLNHLVHKANNITPEQIDRFHNIDSTYVDKISQNRNLNKDAINHLMNKYGKSPDEFVSHKNAPYDLVDKAYRKHIDDFINTGKQNLMSLYSYKIDKNLSPNDYRTYSNKLLKSFQNSDNKMENSNVQSMLHNIYAHTNNNDQVFNEHLNNIEKSPNGLSNILDKTDNINSSHIHQILNHANNGELHMRNGVQGTNLVRAMELNKIPLDNEMISKFFKSHIINGSDKLIEKVLDYPNLSDENLNKLRYVSSNEDVIKKVLSSDKWRNKYAI